MIILDEHTRFYNEEVLGKKNNKCGNDDKNNKCDKDDKNNKCGNDDKNNKCDKDDKNNKCDKGDNDDKHLLFMSEKRLALAAQFNYYQIINELLELAKTYR